LNPSDSRDSRSFETDTKGGDWDSWGLWEGSDRDPGTGVFIAISDKYLASKQSFADYENQTVDKLLHLRNGRRN